MHASSDGGTMEPQLFMLNVLCGLSRPGHMRYSVGVSIVSIFIDTTTTVINTAFGLVLYQFFYQWFLITLEEKRQINYNNKELNNKLFFCRGSSNGLTKSLL